MIFDLRVKIAVLYERVGIKEIKSVALK